MGNNLWQRKVGPFLSPYPTIKDTIVYTNKAKKRQYFVFTTNKSSESYKGRYASRVPNSTQYMDSINTFEIKMLYPSKYKEASKYSYKITRTQKLKISPNDNRVKLGAETRYSEELWHEKLPNYYTKRLKRTMSHFKEGVPKATGGYHYYQIFIDTLDYIQNSYIRGQQEFYNVDGGLDKNFLSYTNIYKKGKLHTMTFPTSCQTKEKETGRNWVYCTIDDVKPLSLFSQNYTESLDLVGKLQLVFGRNTVKKTELKYYKSKNNKIRYYCKYKNIRYSLHKKYIKGNLLYSFDIKQIMKSYYDNNLEMYMMPTLSYDYYSKAYIRKTKYRPKRIRVIDNIQSQQEFDSLNISYYEQFIPKIGMVYASSDLLRNYKKGNYIIKISNVVRYCLSRKVKGNPKKSKVYSYDLIIKHFDRNGKLISKKKGSNEFKI